MYIWTVPAQWVCHNRLSFIKMNRVMTTLEMLRAGARTSLHLEISFGRHLVLTFRGVLEAYFFILPACNALNIYPVFCLVTQVKGTLLNCLQYQNYHCIAVICNDTQTLKAYASTKIRIMPM